MASEQARLLREQARKLRAVAETIQNPLTRESLIGEAATYERMAEAVERNGEPGHERR